MSSEERRGFGDYIEGRNEETSMPNDATFNWQELMRHAQDYIREIRGED